MIYKTSLFVTAAAGCFASTAAFGQAAPQATGSPPATEAAPSSPSSTTSAVTNEGGVEEIIVTAQHRKENLQKVPIAVTVASASRLEASGIIDAQSLKIAMPGVEVQASNGSALPFVRGVGSKAIGGGIETPVAVYVDDVYYGVATANIFSFNNLSQVEVLKGPQGTLFGRNATGGLIHIHTVDPQESFGGKFNIGYGNYETLSGDAYITGGLAPGVAMDLAVIGTTMGSGFGTNLFNGKDVYKISHEFGARSKIVASVGSDTEVRLIFDYSDSISSMLTNRLLPGTTAPAPFGPSYGGDPWDTNLDTMPYIKSHGGGVSGRIDQDFGSVKLSSITAFRKASWRTEFEQDQTPTRGRIVNILNTDDQFSQELQFKSNSNSKLSWIFGLFYFNAHSKYDFFRQNLLGPAIGPNLVTQNFTLSQQDTASIAGFGEVSYKLTDRLQLTGGLRYTSEKRSLVDASLTSTLTTGETIVRIPNTNLSRTFNKLTWRAVLDYQFSDDVFGYVSANRGFKSGGYNTLNITLPEFRPEVLDAYEIGLKTTLLDNRVRLNMAGYYYNYGDVQVQVASAAGTGTANGTSAEIYGAEFELEAQVTDALRLNAGYQYTHARYGDFPGAIIAIPRAAGGVSVTIGNAKGNRVVSAPTSTLSASANYSIPVGSGAIDVNGSYYYNSGSFGDPDNYLKQKPYSLVNASMRWRPTAASFSVLVWGRNLSNEAVTNILTVQSFGATGIARASYAPPRTYGVTLGVNF